MGNQHRNSDMVGLTFFFTAYVFSVFRVPVTHDMLTAVLDPQSSKTFFDLFTLAIMGFEIGLFFILPSGFRRYFYLVIFVFWRLSYNLGLGILLKYQSDERGLVNLAKKYKVFDAKKNPKVNAWLKHQFTRKMGKDYDFEVSTNSNTRLTPLKKWVPLLVINSPMSHRPLQLNSIHGFFTDSWLISF
jgi:phosphatidylethanolamine N-methyltransferase